MPKVFKARSAQTDLFDIWGYIAEASLARADAFADQLEETFSLLAENPRMGRKRDDLGEGLHSFPIDKHLIVYRPFNTGIIVVRVLHTRRNIEDFF